MNLTRKIFQIAIPRLALQSNGLVILFAFVHVVSDAVTNMLSALLPTIQSRFGLSGTTLALLVATLSLIDGVDRSRTIGAWQSENSN